MDELGGAIAAAAVEAGGALASLVLVRLEGLARLEDSLGGPVAQEAAQIIAERMAAASGVDFVRMADDTFAGVTTAADGRAVASSAASAASEPVAIYGREISVTACAGLADARSGENGAEIVRNARLALRDARQRRPSSVTTYDPTIRAALLARIELEQQLRWALRHDHLVLHYQPIVGTHSLEITGVEALVRWLHPTEGLLGPMRFIPLAEETGLIADVDEWVIGEACRQAARWRSEGRADLVVSVNLSPSEIGKGRLTSAVAKALAATGLPPDAVQFEITETVLMAQDAGTREGLDALRSLGSRLAIDDFGTGYSSLAYLKHLPVDMLKVDRMFIEGLGGVDPQDDAIMGAVIALAAALDLDVTAEGVETRAQLESLRRLGCDSIQGFLISRPVAPAELRR